VIELSLLISCILQLSDWDRYAAEEYELLVAEEGASDHQDEA
jgi:serine/threonine-protein phosphatase 2A regulatory subunit B''